MLFLANDCYRDRVELKVELCLLDRVKSSGLYYCHHLLVVLCGKLQCRDNEVDAGRVTADLSVAVQGEISCWLDRPG